MRRSTFICLFVFVTGLGAVMLAQDTARGGMLPGDGAIPQPICATTSQWELNGRYRSESLPGGLPDGEPFLFDQDPPIMFADYDGPLTLHNFSVVGDYASVDFVRYSIEFPNGRTETWQRQTSRSVDGQLVSVFEPTWNSRDLDAAFTYRRFGFDRPLLYWGAFQIPGSTLTRNVYLRAGLHGIPASSVVRVNNQVQYASDVVNLVVPTFDDSRVMTGTRGFDIAAATRLFYQYFTDSYDVIAMTPQSVPVAEYGAFHQNVRNVVTGLNISTFDQSQRFGSNGVLQGAEVYGSSYITRYEDTDHEMAHQWASNFDWARISNVARAGHQPTGHSPLWTGGETLIGAVLLGNRRVATAPSGGYTIERTPAPARFHPIELYAMGLLDPTSVPDFQIFLDQGQFDPDTAVSPAVGTAVSGATQTVSINDLVGVHGARQGPTIAPVWRRATVLVSRDRLATQQEMDYWNFFAQRLSDRNGASRPSLDNYVSFRRATGGTVNVATAVRPISQAPVSQALEIDTPSFGGNDWRGVTFTSSMPGRFEVGASVTVTGRVTAPDPVDFDSVGLGFWTATATTPVTFYGAVNRTRDFSVTVRFTDAQRGTYYLSNYLYWPNSGSQYPRSSVSTIVVE